MYAAVIESSITSGEAFVVFFFSGRIYATSVSPVQCSYQLQTVV